MDWRKWQCKKCKRYNEDANKVVPSRLEGYLQNNNQGAATAEYMPRSGGATHVPTGVADATYVPPGTCDPQASKTYKTCLRCRSKDRTPPKSKAEVLKEIEDDYRRLAVLRVTLRRMNARLEEAVRAKEEAAAAQGLVPTDQDASRD